MGLGAQGEAAHHGQWSFSEATERLTSSWPTVLKWMWTGTRVGFTQPRDSLTRLPGYSCWRKITATEDADIVWVSFVGIQIALNPLSLHLELKTFHWDMRNAKCTVNFKGESINICCSPNGQTIAVGSKDGVVTFTDVKTHHSKPETLFEFKVNKTPGTMMTWSPWQTARAVSPF